MHLNSTKYFFLSHEICPIFSIAGITLVYKKKIQFVVLISIFLRCVRVGNCKGGFDSSKLSFLTERNIIDYPSFITFSYKDSY